MASEHDTAGALPADLEAWLADRATETGYSRQALLARAVVAYRLLDETADGAGALDAELSALESRLETVESTAESSDVTALETLLEDRYTELKDRIVDVLKETRNRAPKDHSHPALSADLETLTAEFDALASDLDSLTDDHDQLAETVETGFANVEQIEGDLADSVDRLDTRSDRLAGAVVDLRRRLSRVERIAVQQEALDRLLTTAHTSGVSKATCESCRETVRLGLLNSPSCPHCGAAFDAIEPGGFLRQSIVTVGSPPALEAGQTDSAATETDSADPSEPTDVTTK